MTPEQKPCCTGACERDPEDRDDVCKMRALSEENERLKEAMRNALCCTPGIYVGEYGYEIRYDCGDPWEILRAALGEKQ